MNSRYIKALVYAAAGVLALVLAFSGQQPQPSWLRPVGFVATAVVYLAFAFELWLWKLPFLHGWFVKRPVISGTWRCVLRSSWKDPSTGVTTPPVEGFMVIRQTLSTLSVRLLTPESHSELVGTQIVCAPDGQYCLSGVYRNEPRLEARAKSPIHFGAVWLRVVEEPVKELIGHYWTDRGTAGEMELTERQKERFQTFQAARDHFARLPTTGGVGQAVLGSPQQRSSMPR